MERTGTLIRETRTIGLDNHLIPHRQKQLELNREGNINVHHLFNLSSHSLKHTHTPLGKYRTLFPLYASV